MQWYVYIIRASDDSLYTGITTDVERRFREHSGEGQGKDKRAKFFRGREPVEVVHVEKHPDRSSALKREAAIKGLDREQKVELVKAGLKPPRRPC